MGMRRIEFNNSGKRGNKAVTKWAWPVFPCLEQSKRCQYHSNDAIKPMVLEENNKVWTIQVSRSYSYHFCACAQETETSTFSLRSRGSSYVPLLLCFERALEISERLLRMGTTTSWTCSGCGPGEKLSFRSPERIGV